MFLGLFTSEVFCFALLMQLFTSFCQHKTRVLVLFIHYHVLLYDNWKSMNFNESCYNEHSCTVHVANEIVICPRAAGWIKYLSVPLKIVMQSSDKHCEGSGNVWRVWEGFGLPWRSLDKEREREGSGLCSLTHVCTVCQHWAWLNKARQELASQSLTRI